MVDSRDFNGGVCKPMPGPQDGNGHGTHVAGIALGTNDERGPSTEAAPQELTVANPAAGRHYLVMSRAKVGGVGVGDFGSFVLTLDEIRA